ncbi:MAG: hypothetical protein LQ342_000049 [Letrouitia transgressa]|nr:MAG: hypothetical protein LQ342_000049 [Letrouitia transgressa]
MGDFNQIAQQFTEFYYNTFDENRQQLAALYVHLPIPPLSITPLPIILAHMPVQRDQSMLTFETAAIQGTSGILEKLTSLPFDKIKHQVSTLDAQPSNEAGGILVMVTGALLVDEEQRPMNYTQTFQLLPDGAGSYFVFNDVFRLIYSSS